MPRYFFNVYNSDITLDQEGTVLADLSKANNHARQAARDLVCDDIQRTGGFNLYDYITITDKHEKELEKLLFHDVVAIRDGRHRT